ncbi:MAG: PIN domain-containing protein, partial [Candidatus Omnitrophota bacterium]
MDKEKLYLDTSVISAYYDQRVKERQKETIKFWKKILPGYEIYISEITVREIANTKQISLRKKLTKLINGFRVLKLNKSIRSLANSYVEGEIFSKAQRADAFHVAAASFHGIYYLASWNFEHLVKVKTRKMVSLVN